MTPQVERRAIPTLMGGQRKQIQPGYGHVHTLLDLLQEGFYLLFMLKNGSVPPGEAAFLDAITRGAASRVLLIDGPAVLGWEEWRRLDGEGPEQELRTGLREAGVSPALLGPLTAALSGAMNELALWLVARPDDDDARTDAHAALHRLLNAVAPRS